jgi:hypothetical protein
MRLIVLPLILAALPAAAAPPAPSAEAPPVDRMAPPAADTCARGGVYQAETPKAPESRKLGELPPGDLLLSVYNQVDGCMEPVIVRYGDGRVPSAEQPARARPGARVWR